MPRSRVRTKLKVTVFRDWRDVEIGHHTIVRSWPGDNVTLIDGVDGQRVTVQHADIPDLLRALALLRRRR